MPRWPTRTREDFWTLGCEVSGADECWPARGRLTPKGYGQFWFEGRRHQAHVFAWELVNGSVPNGLQVDHLCRRRDCCNPRHGEPVTPRENTARSPIHNGSKTHCPADHAYAIHGKTRLIKRKDRLYPMRYCTACEKARWAPH